jgi:hypothetical protein
MKVEIKAKVSREVTGSKINTIDLINGVNSIGKALKKEIHLKLRTMLDSINIPQDKALPIIREGINKIANDYKIDAAILFWTFVEFEEGL